MYLPSQERALGLLQCLDIIEKTGELPQRKDGPLCRDAQKWDGQKILYYLTEFFDIEEPEFYHGKKEQNILLAEETLRELVNRDDSLQEMYEILLDYSKELPPAESCQIILPENKDYNPNKTNPDTIPNIWKWANCQLLFVSLDCCLKDPNGAKIKKTLKTIEEYQEGRPDGIVVYNYDRKHKKENNFELSIVDDIWYRIPEEYQFKNLSWIGRNHMCIEQCIEIMEKIRGENHLGKVKEIKIL